MNLTYARDPKIPAEHAGDVLATHIGSWSADRLQEFWEVMENYGVPWEDKTLEGTCAYAEAALATLRDDPGVSETRVEFLDYFFAAWSDDEDNWELVQALRVVDALDLPPVWQLRFNDVVVWFDPDGPPQVMRVTHLPRGSTIIGLATLDGDGYTEAPHHEVSPTVRRV